MRSSRIAIALVLFALVAAFAVPGAIACDKTNAAKAETASTANCDPAACAKAGCDPASCPKAAAATAETASATTAQAGACASKTAAETASATTAQAGACASKTAAETASATTAQAGSCASKTAAAQTAGTAGCSKMATASAGCSSSQASAAKYDIAIETVKLPSGALAVIYSGKDADTVAMLHSSANGSAADFGCPNVQKMVASENCTVEMASTEDGLIFLCTSDDVALIESFQQNYEVAVATPVEEVQGE